MRIQFQILLFILCLNIATGIIGGLALPPISSDGSEVGMNPGTLGGNATDYESRFNATDLADRWRATPFSGIPVVGDLFSGFYMFFTMILPDLLDGFPYLLTWVGDMYFTGTTAETAFTVLAYAFRAIFAMMMGIFVIELITGRRMPD